MDATNERPHPWTATRKCCFLEFAFLLTSNSDLIQGPTCSLTLTGVNPRMRMRWQSAVVGGGGR